MHTVLRGGVILLTIILIAVLNILNNELLELGGLIYALLLGVIIWSMSYLWKMTKPKPQLLKRDEIGVNGYTEMMWACEVGDEELLRKLISKNINLNNTDAYGATALMYAASFGNKNCVTTLLEHGADAEVSTKHGDTAQKFAEDKGNYEIAKILRDWQKTEAPTKNRGLS